MTHIPKNPAHARFRTGARRTPPHKIAHAVLTGRLGVHQAFAPPPQVIYSLPPQLSMWLNDQYGDCVSAEEAAAIAAFSMFCNKPEVFIPDSSVMAFASRYGLLNGADLLSVVQDMQQTGMLGPDGSTYYKDGVPSTVDMSSEAAIQSAIAANGPLKIGIASGGLPSGAGNQMGWSAFGGSPDHNEDHCVGLWHYGTAQALCQAFGWPLPANAPSGIVYTLYTWHTIGLVDKAWLDAYCGEGYTRTPTSLQISPTPTPTPVPPTPTPTPPTPTPTPMPGNMVMLDGTLPAGTYYFSAAPPVNPQLVSLLTQALALLQKPTGKATFQLSPEALPKINWCRLLDLAASLDPAAAPVIAQLKSLIGCP